MLLLRVLAEIKCPVNTDQEQRGQSGALHDKKVSLWTKWLDKNTWNNFPEIREALDTLVDMIWDKEKKKHEVGFVVTSQWQLQHWVAGALWQVAPMMSVADEFSAVKGNMYHVRIVTSLSFSSSQRGSEDKSRLPRRYQAHCSRRHWAAISHVQWRLLFNNGQRQIPAVNDISVSDMKGVTKPASCCGKQMQLMLQDLEWNRVLAASTLL